MRTRGRPTHLCLIPHAPQGYADKRPSEDLGDAFQSKRATKDGQRKGE
jgi:hypothetical protein